MTGKRCSARGQAQGSGHEGPDFIRKFLRIRSLCAGQDTDQGLTNSADHERNGQMRSDVIGDEAVTLCRLEHSRAGGKLSVGESPLDIQHFGRATQSPDDKGAKG
jgi:hypothetical protein